MFPHYKTIIPHRFYSMRDFPMRGGADEKRTYHPKILIQNKILKFIKYLETYT